MKNGISKIKKWLKTNGYNMSYCEYELYYHNDSFHKGELYILDIYRTSNGYYIKVKTQGRPRYYLCESNKGLHSVKRIAFSQIQFTQIIKDLFPNLKELQ